MENDLIRRSDALRVFCEFCGVCPEAKRNPKECDDILGNVLVSLPAVDAVEVVRCRECKHNAQPPDKGFAQCELDALIREPEFWCRAGARMDGEREETEVCIHSVA